MKRFMILVALLLAFSVTAGLLILPDYTFDADQSMDLCQWDTTWLYADSDALQVIVIGTSGDTTFYLIDYLNPNPPPDPDPPKNPDQSEAWLMDTDTDWVPGELR
jgi:hypothetical protein